MYLVATILDNISQMVKQTRKSKVTMYWDQYHKKGWTWPYKVGFQGKNTQVIQPEARGQEKKIHLKKVDPWIKS